MGSTRGTDAGHPHGSLENVDVAHEESDINIPAIVWFVAILVATTLSIHLSMWGLMKFFGAMERRDDPVVSPLMAGAGQRPPEPSLQTTPWEDLRKFRAQEDSLLHGYGWVDEKAGVARVPIAKAKELLLQRGLPVLPGQPDPAEGTHVAAEGEASGGRTIPAGGADKSSPPAPTAAAPGAQPAPAPAPAPPKGPGGER